MTARSRFLLGAAAIACVAAACHTAVPEPTAAVSGVSPLGALERPSTDDVELAGVVAERLAAGSYSYLRVETDDGSRWIATTGAGAAPGEHIRVRSMGTRNDFYSPRLERHFDELVFGFLVPSTPDVEPLPS